MIEMIFDTVLAVALVLLLIAFIVYFLFSFIKAYWNNKSTDYKMQLLAAEETIAELNDIIHSRDTGTTDTSTTDTERARRLADRKSEIERHCANEVGKIEYIALYYGWEAQSRQCIEEMAEATKAINKLWRYEHGYLPQGTATEEELKRHTLEEIVDTVICIEELLCFLEEDFDDMWAVYDEILNKKLDRAIQRIKDKEENKSERSYFNGQTDGRAEFTEHETGNKLHDV